MPVFTKSKKPDSKMNFFQNYNNHINYLEDKFLQISDEITRKVHPNKASKTFGDFCNNMKEEPNIGKLLDAVGTELVKHLSLFDKLRDGHDYFDEVVGATALPLIGMCASAAGLGMALFEAGTALAIRCNLATNDRADHMSNAANALLFATVSFVASLVLFIKSAISMVTRPIVTALNGFEKQDEVRFINEDSLQAKARF